VVRAPHLVWWHTEYTAVLTWYPNTFAVPEQAAWNTMLSDLAGKYTDIPVREVNKTLNDMGDGEFSPRPNMKVRRDVAACCS